MKQALFVLSVVLFVAGCANSGIPVKGHSVHAFDSRDKKTVMAHVSPMPNLMPVAVSNADVLKLSEEQTKALAEGRSERLARVENLASGIINEERKIHQAALDGKSSDQINSMSTSLVRKRLTLIEAKVSCRDVVREVLNENQWTELLALYK
jgi:hypothetical protein